MKQIKGKFLIFSFTADLNFFVFKQALNENHNIEVYDVPPPCLTTIISIGDKNSESKKNIIKYLREFAHTGKAVNTEFVII